MYIQKNNDIITNLKIKKEKKKKFKPHREISYKLRKKWWSLWQENSRSPHRWDKCYYDKRNLCLIFPSAEQKHGMHLSFHVCHSTQINLEADHHLMPDNKSHLDLFMNLSTSRNMRIKI
jgi:hypothetical protein